MKRKHRQKPLIQATIRGYTLVELLAALSIAAVLAFKALPDMSDMYQRLMAHYTSNQLVQLIQVSRSKATSSKTMVSLCPSKDGQSCIKNWRHGIIVFIDLDQNGKRTAGENIVLHSEPFPEGSWLDWRAFGNRNYLQYTAEGYTNHQNGRFAYCPAKGGNRYAQQIIINKAGRPRKASKPEIKKKYCNR